MNQIDLNRTWKFEGKKVHWSNWEKQLVSRILERYFDQEAITLNFPDEQRTIGRGKPAFKITPPKLSSLIRIIIDPDYYGCEEYINGNWSCEDQALSDFIIFVSTKSKFNNGFGQKLFSVLAKPIFYLSQSLYQKSSKLKVRHHYNFVDKFYELVIGQSMLYSCAFFKNQNMTLDEAQQYKLETIIKRLEIPKSYNAQILDIGCGWGATAIKIAEETKATITGISIAKHQIKYANEWKEKLDKDISDRLNFQEQDFRNYVMSKEKCFDRICSVGMLEHVGKLGYSDYFKNISRLLKNDGIALIHSMVTHEPNLPHKWIDKHIFPNGYIPEVAEILSAAAKNGLQPYAVHIHNGENYIQTLKSWDANLIEKFDSCYSLVEEKLLQDLEPNDEQFDPETLDDLVKRNLRIWHLYLSSFQTVFHRHIRSNDVCQFVFKKMTHHDLKNKS
ncbi:cyclopropane-fatty-acyl-phospholipid synthase family protein [Terasakiella sp. A23]|uniref:cyclopropane-fatty-acyl-phospholipid synthase family protein n=1 Tax=Terasakiella sp. FCG-A23 TaxID=3080561 RepID=UPI0029558E93|nr:cyclopropane-fatty-acyl-phospholipid synthase family protein [Terasakiella sp. A23]MDV7339591.1 cyclopropane-fatty-acyl-phospholipid synthase family protein [Terasakiella sp. A23]